MIDSRMVINAIGKYRIRVIEWLVQGRDLLAGEQSLSLERA
jgi:Lon protease-like protein